MLNAKQTEKMKTFNKAISLQTARQLVRSINSAYPNTQHNREMIATATREIIKELQEPLGAIQKDENALMNF